MDKVFLVNKPIGITSFDVVYKLRKSLNIKRIGHTGTLDPFADGLLIICAGEATKICRFIEEESKTYLATLKLGVRTDTGDLTGKIIEEKPQECIDVSSIKMTLDSFIGYSEQIPPMYSAIKVNGKKLYELARKGEEIERKPRRILIDSISLISYKDNTICFEVSCSKGTYIRTLAEDIALRLGTVGHLTNLTRTRIGGNYLKSAKSIDEITENDGISISEALIMPHIIATPEQAADIKNGKKVELDNQGEYILFVSNNQIPLAIYKRLEGKYACERGFNIC